MPSRPLVHIAPLVVLRRAATARGLALADGLASGGQVKSLKVEGNRVSGYVGVRAQSRADVLLVGPNDTVGACSRCPAEARRGPCEHVLALAIVALSRRLAVEASIGANLPADAAPAATVDLTLVDLRAWAMARGVGGRLLETAGRVNAALGLIGATSSMPTWTVEHVITRADADRDQARLFCAWLEEQADLVAAVKGYVAGRATARVPPTEPTLAREYERVLAARTTSPILPDHARLLPSDLHGLALHAKDPVLTVLSRRPCAVCARPSAEPVARLAPELDPPVLVCSRAVCPSTTSALDTLLDALGAPSPDPLVIEFAERLARPEWRRTLDFVAKTRPAPSAAVIGFALEGQGGTVTVTPVEVGAAERGRARLRRLWQSPPAIDRADRLRLHILGAFETVSAPKTVALLLPELMDTPHVYRADGRPIRVEITGVTLEAVEKAGSGGPAYTLVVRIGDQQLPVADAAEALALAPSLMHWNDAGDVVWLSEPSPEALAVIVAAKSLPAELPEDAGVPLVSALSRAHAPFVAPPSLDGSPIAVEPMTIIQALWRPATLSLAFGLEYCPDPAQGGYPVLRPNDKPDRLSLTVGGELRCIARDIADERRRQYAVAAWLEVDSETIGIGTGVTLSGLSAVTALQRLADLTSPGRPSSFRVDWRSVPPTVAVATAGHLAVEVGVRRDWFDLAGALHLGGHVVPLPLLLRAIREGQQFVEASPGFILTLSDALSSALERLASAEDSKARGDGSDRMALSRFGPFLLADLSDVGVHIDAPATWQARLTAMAAAGASDVPLPLGLDATLRPYQEDGFRWLARLAAWAPGACLCDDMGLGKTVQAIALLLHRAAEGPGLVVAPTSVGFNWSRELARFAPTLVVKAFRGAGDKELPTDPGSGDVILTSYDLLTLYPERFRGRRWGTVIFDEAQAIKNPHTRRARAAAVLDAGFRVALTGTPIENRTSELWSLFNITLPGLLGPYDAFQRRFVGPIERVRDPRARALLSQMIRPFLLRRLKRDVAAELPVRTEITVDVTLTPAERVSYDALRRSVLDALTTYSVDAVPGHVRMIQILTALTRLRQAACHPRLIDKASTVPSSKLAVLLDLVESLRAEGHRALVFSQFTAHLELVREALDRTGVTYRYLDGSMPAAARSAEIDAFQAGHGELFLLSLKAGGVGLNLTGADYVIHLDPWWNPAAEDQATDRAHRLGQTRPVTVLRLITKDTIEEQITVLHADKRALTEAILAGTAESAALSPDALVALIRAGTSIAQAISPAAASDLYE